MSRNYQLSHMTHLLWRQVEVMRQLCVCIAVVRGERVRGGEGREGEEREGEGREGERGGGERGGGERG